MQDFDTKETLSLVGGEEYADPGEDIANGRLFRSTKRLPPNAIVELVETTVTETVDGDVETLEVVLLPESTKVLAYALPPAAGEVQTTVGTHTLAKSVQHFGVRLKKADESVPSAPSTGEIIVRLRGRY